MFVASLILVLLLPCTISWPAVSFLSTAGSRHDVCCRVHLGAASMYNAMASGNLFHNDSTNYVPRLVDLGSAGTSSCQLYNNRQQKKKQLHVLYDFSNRISNSKYVHMDVTSWYVFIAENSDEWDADTKKKKASWINMKTSGTTSIRKKPLMKASFRFSEIFEKWFQTESGNRMAHT